MNLLLAAYLALAAPAAAPDVAVVCPAPLAPALDPWLAHRRAQGHEIAVIHSTRDATAIRSAIRALAEQGALRSVLLVGDAPNRAAEDQSLGVPAHLCPAQVNLLWGSEPYIATDNWYADLDDDQVPDLAIGRLTADSAEELSLIVKKILAYERQPDFGAWRRRVNFVAGVGGFGAWTDSILETVTGRLLAEHIPPAYGTSMTYASWRSPFCPDPRAFAEQTRQRLSEGCLFWVYMGHGHRRTLDWLQVPGGEHRIFDVRDVAQLTCQSGSPIALFLACYTGAYDGAEDCLAEEMLRDPQAPVAVIAGSRVTMPYAMAVMGMALLEQTFVERRATLGEVLLLAKRQMVAPPQAGTRALVDLLASALSPTPHDLAAERLEHLQLFNLLGDPLLRLRHAQSATVETAPAATAGEPLRVTGETPLAGRCIVELVARRDRLTFSPPLRAKYDPTPAALAAMQTVYQRANDTCYVRKEIHLPAGSFELTLDVPPEAAGACHVRVYITGQNDFALGSANIEIRPAE